MYWIDILSRLQFVSLFFFLAGAVSMMVTMSIGNDLSWKSLVKLVVITFILFLISALVAFFAPSAEYIEYLKGGICE